MRILSDWKCQSCGHTFEKLVDSKVDTIDCIECGESAIKQLSAPGGFQFKGNGYYCTDFKGKK